MRWIRKRSEAGQPEVARLASRRDAKEQDARHLFAEAKALYERGELHEALSTFGRALAIFSEVGPRSREGGTLSYLGLIYHLLGQPQEALEHYRQALAIAREVRDRRGQAYTLGNLGLLQKDLGRPQEALAGLALDASPVGLALGPPQRCGAAVVPPLDAVGLGCWKRRNEAGKDERPKQPTIEGGKHALVKKTKGRRRTR